MSLSPTNGGSRKEFVAQLIPFVEVMTPGKELAPGTLGPMVATKFSLKKVTALRSWVVGADCWVQVAPSGDVRTIPLRPTATNLFSANVTWFRYHDVSIGRICQLIPLVEVINRPLPTQTHVPFAQVTSL